MSTHRRTVRTRRRSGPDPDRTGGAERRHRHHRTGARRAATAGRPVRAGLRSQRDRRGPGNARSARCRRCSTSSPRRRSMPRCRSARHTRALPPWRVRDGGGSAAGSRRLLHRDRGSRRLTRGRRHHRQARGLQPVSRRRRHVELPRARELLAHHLQPVARRERRRPGRLPRLGELLGRVASRLDAPPRHLRREPLADGLLHRRSAVRERRLHRRLPPAVRDQWLTAAVAHPQQRGGRLVERRVEPGVLGRRGRTGRRRLPEPAVHHAR